MTEPTVAPPVACPNCGKVLCDGEALKGLSVIVLEAPVRGLCRRCKSWVKLPLKLQPI